MWRCACLVEGLHNVGEVYPGGTGGQHLVEQVVSEQLQQIAISSLTPLHVPVKPTHTHSRQHTHTLIPAHSHTHTHTHTPHTAEIPPSPPETQLRQHTSGLYVQTENNFW